MFKDGHFSVFLLGWNFLNIHKKDLVVCIGCSTMHTFVNKHLGLGIDQKLLVPIPNSIFRDGSYTIRFL